MNITDFERPEHEQKQGTVDSSSVKWRRSGNDRRSENPDSFFEEKRGIVGRRINWFTIISSIIFPRHSKIK